MIQFLQIEKFRFDYITEDNTKYWMEAAAKDSEKLKKG
jgi:hypothetical protein